MAADDTKYDAKYRVARAYETDGADEDRWDYKLMTWIQDAVRNQQGYVAHIRPDADMTIAHCRCPCWGPGSARSSFLWIGIVRGRYSIPSFSRCYHFLQQYPVPNVLLAISGHALEQLF